MVELSKMPALCLASSYVLDIKRNISSINHKLDEFLLLVFQNYFNILQT